MDWTAKIETDRNVLKRIVAILFALAELADRASGRSWPIRCLVLPFLYRAEDAALAFITGSADGANFTLSPPACGMAGLTAPRRDGPIDAMRLALSLRTLALTVQAMLAQARPCWRSRRGGCAGLFVASAPSAGHRDADRLLQEASAVALPCLALKNRPDTS